jgi:hypothetical protein
VRFALGTNIEDNNKNWNWVNVWSNIIANNSVPEDTGQTLHRQLSCADTSHSLPSSGNSGSNCPTMSCTYCHVYQVWCD